MEELNKSQLILLALLVSFITSIATGIVTVTLMDQAPPGVTQTVNRIVQHTVERVVPGETQTIVKEVPIIVTEEDLIVEAVNLVSPVTFQVIKVSKIDPLNRESVGSAVLVNKDKGRLITTSSIKEEAGFSYILAVVDEKSFPINILTSDSKLAVVEVTASSRTEFITFFGESSLVGFDTSGVSIGQTVIGLGASSGGNHVVAVGIVSSLNGTPEQTIIRSNVATAEIIGGAILNIKGELVGITVAPGEIATSAQVQALVDSIK